MNVVKVTDIFAQEGDRPLSGLCETESKILYWEEDQASGNTSFYCLTKDELEAICHPSPSWPPRTRDAVLEGIYIKMLGRGPIDLGNPTLIFESEA